MNFIRKMLLVSAMVLSIAAAAGCSKNETSEPESKGTIPVSNASWGDTEERIIEVMGAEPNDSYEKDGGKKVLEYYDQKLDDVDGIIRYNLIDGVLSSVSFFIPVYEDETFRHFDQKYREMYGDPDDLTNIGEIWYEEDGNVGLAATNQMGGLINITFAPATRSEKAESETAESR